MRKKKFCSIRKPARRLLALLLAVVVLCGVMPPVNTAVEAASWMDPFLHKVVEWGVMRGDLDGNLRPEHNITRAEFVTMINRAFGYTETGSTPFKDVKKGDWFADDIGIAYNMGYLVGTSKTTASPNKPITREEAMVMLGKNLMYRPQPGEVVGFKDSRTFSQWSKGYIRIAAATDVISGYPDGTFRPQKNIQRGEAACIIVKSLGNIVNTPGDVTLGGVYGNVLVSVPGVRLKNTMIAGDLYLAGGVGLGDVILENVTVLGRIIISGAGESHKGDSSVILRNVQANEMIVDSLKDQFVTIRAEGDTTIDFTSVRTSAYIEDVTPSPYGLKYIEIDGEAGISVQLAGNIKEVVNISPGSQLVIAQGTAERVTIDEKAKNSTLVINQGASVKELNLDVGTAVSGEGDIGHANINAPGSTITILPDTITIRPGITATIDGEEMDSVAGNESSAEPRLLAGYPTIRNLAPTAAEAVFSTNKRATVYWALSAKSDGSIGEDDLIDPPAESGKILKRGTIEAETSNTEISAKVTGLTSDGSYYLSAVMVDRRGQRSPVKVTSFTTPDNTVPKFASGYPSMIKVTKDAGQVAVMSSKTCQLYYALFPKGSTPPKVSDFKSGALDGNLGYGVRDVTKNVIDLFYVNNQTLQELETYDLYLCLIDADGGKDSGVKKLSFTTVDGTPPVFITDPTVNSVKETSVGLTAALNEQGTIFWAVVQQGAEYPKPMAGQLEKPALNSPEAKLQVASGMNALKSGKVSAQANRDVSINVTGLEAQKGYDLYYVAQDKAGNYSEWVKKITIHTLDTVPPTIKQEFTKTGDEAGKEPMPDTDIRIVFSEGVQDQKSNQIFYELYQKSQDPSLTEGERQTANRQLTELVRKDIQLWDASSFPAVAVPEKAVDPSAQPHWVDYSKIEVKMEDGKTVFIFRSGEAVKLTSGGTYYFQISEVCDTSNNKNPIKPDPTKLPPFTTVFAQINLQSQGVNLGPEGKRVDMSFRMHPVSTNTVEESIAYDIFLWSGSLIKFNVYARAVDGEGKPATDPIVTGMNGVQGPDKNGWYNLGERGLTPDAGKKVGTSVRKGTAAGGRITYPKLKDLKEGYIYEYAIEITRVNNQTNPDSWSDKIAINVTIPAGPETNVGNLANLITEENWDASVHNGLTQGGVKPVGKPDDFEVFKQFSDTQVPQFTTPYPTFVPGDSFVNMNFQLDRAGTIYYALAPVQSPGSGYRPTLETIDKATGKTVEKDLVPTDGGGKPKPPELSKPVDLDIFKPNFGSSRIKHGNAKVAVGLSEVMVKDLEARTTYFAYFVLKGDSQKLSPVYCYQFTTTEVTTPAVILNELSPGVDVTTTTPSETSWALYANDSLFPLLRTSFQNYVKADKLAEYQANYKTYFPTATSPQEPKVIDALVAKMPTSDYSVFDEFTNEQAYNQVLGRIQGKITGGTNYAGRGDITLEQGVPKNVDCTKFMTGITQYYFLAAARNTQGSQYSFKAVGNVHLPDTKPPELTRVDTSNNPFAAEIENRYSADKYKIKKGTWEGDPYSYAYKGTLTINFDELIYQLISHDGNHILEDLTLDNLVDKLASAETQLTAKKVGSTIQLDYMGAVDGANITFFADGSISDADSNSHGGGQKLVLTFKVMSGDIVNVPNPHWEYTWSDQ